MISANYYQVKNLAFGANKIDEQDARKQRGLNTDPGARAAHMLEKNDKRPGQGAEGIEEARNRTWLI